MGAVYKETFTKPLPPGAKLIVRKGKRLAEWRDAKGKTRTAPLTAAGDRITVEAGTYTAKYRDGSGIVREVSTGCRDETAARSVLTELERRAEKVKGKILSADEAAAIDQQDRPLSEHVDAYLTKLGAAGTSSVHRANVRRALDRLAADCRFHRLADLSRESLERWLVSQEKSGMGPRTRNTYRAAAVAFCNWCIETGRLLCNPFAKVPKADENVDPRRALTEDEIVRLLDVARRRPLVEAMTIRTGKRKGEAVARVRDEARRELERLGWERALIYKTLVLTGLRKGELASLTAGQLDLDGPVPRLTLDASDEKNRQGSTVPLRADLAADLREWLADRAKAAQDRPTVPYDANRRPRNPHQAEAGRVLLLAATTTLPPDDAGTPGLARPAVRGQVGGVQLGDRRGHLAPAQALREADALPPQGRGTPG